MGLTIPTALPRTSEDASETHWIPPSCRRWVCVQPTPDLRVPREGKQHLSPRATLAAGTCPSTRSHKGLLGAPSRPAAEGRVGPPALPGPSSGIPLESSRPNASKGERRRQDPPSAMLPPALPWGPAIWAGSGVGWGGELRRAFPRGGASGLGPSRAHRRGGDAAGHENRPQKRPAPTRAPRPHVGAPAPGDPPCAPAAARCHRCPRPAQSPPPAGGAYKGAALAPLPAPPSCPPPPLALTGGSIAPRSRSLPHEMTNVGAPPARALPATSGVTRFPLVSGGPVEGACAGARGLPGARGSHLAASTSWARPVKAERESESKAGPVGPSAPADAGISQPRASLRPSPRT